jgi:hypothetical protein
MYPKYMDLVLIEVFRLCISFSGVRMMSLTSNLNYTYFQSYSFRSSYYVIDKKGKMSSSIVDREVEDPNRQTIETQLSR